MSLSTTKTDTRSRKRRPDALAALRRDPAFLAADPAVKQLVLALLTRGQHAGGEDGRKDGAQ